MLRFLMACIDRVFVLAGAIVLAQAPQFFQAYTQRLAGHLSELRLQLGALQTIAEKLGKTLPEYVQKFSSHTDPEIASQGLFLEQLSGRYQELSVSYQTMVEATPLTRPVHFLWDIQWQVAASTFEDFHLGLTFTLETILYALVGAMLGYALFSGIRKLVFIPINAFRRRFSKPTESAEA